MASGKTIPLEKAKSLAEEAKQVLEEEYAEKVEIVGSIARGHPEVHDIDLLAIAKPDSLLDKDPGTVSDALTQEFGVHIDVFLTTKESWEASLVHWVIGKSVIPLKSHARKMGMHLNRYGLFDHAERPIARTIEEIYDALEIPIPQSLKPFLNHNPPNRRNRV